MFANCVPWPSEEINSAVQNPNAQVHEVLLSKSLNTKNTAALILYFFRYTVIRILLFREALTWTSMKEPTRLVTCHLT